MPPAPSRARGVPVSLDLSSVATMRDLGADMLARRSSTSVAPAVVFANADEAALAAELGLDPAATGGLRRQARRRSRRRPCTTDDARTRSPSSACADVLDSTGAGDAFAAGYIVAALGGATPHESARAGSTLAMSALRRAGAL